MKRRTVYPLTAILASFLLTGCAAPVKQAKLSTLSVAAEKSSKELGGLMEMRVSSPAEAEPKLKDFVEKHDGAKDPQVQDTATKAKVELATLHASEKDYTASREEFLDAADDKGSGEIDPGYGSLSDQAAYQAVVCLVAEGKNSEAVKGFHSLMVDRPLSPIVYACHQRLVKLDKENRTVYDNLLEDDAAKQKAYADEQMSLCGPRVLVELAKFRGEALSLDTAEKECQTTVKDGTTMKNLSRAIRKHGYDVVGKSLNYDDFMSCDLPFVWLNDEHYVLVLQRSEKTLRVYDPMTKGERDMPIDLKNKDAFAATVLTLTPSKENPTR